MSTLQQNQSNSLSPILLSPSSATITNHTSLFDNSDQGSVDSDYTSLGSSKFYGNSGSTSSLHRQGRSQSIDELASTTTIPTRHFNGTLNINKSNNDPLQFVKIHPNHDLIERAQEQLSLAESRKRLQENYNLTDNSNENKVNDDDVDWSKAVDDWRHKREQKRLKNVNSNPADDHRPLSPLKVVPITKHEEIKKLINEPIAKPTLGVSSMPIEKSKSKSPSPMRIKGPAKIREIFIEKPVDIRGFGFKLDGGRTQNRPIFISTIEEGSPADKAGLCIDDDVISMNDENVENMTFDQVRKVLKERNLRGSIKLVVRTYEDLIDDNSQTVSAGFTTDHSRTPSPQKVTYTTTISPSISGPIPKINTSPSSTTNTQSPVYTFLPYTPSPLDPIKNTSVQQTPISSSSSLNIFAPKPFRSTASINLDTQNTHEPNMNYTSPIEAFRKMLNSSNTNDESIYDKELQDLEAEFEKQLRGIDEIHKPETTTTTTNEKQQTNVSKQPPPPVVVNNNTLPTVVNHPPPLSSVESLLHGKSNTDSNTKHPCDESSIAQVRSYVEKQMDQLQQDLEFGFSRTPKIPPSSSSASLLNTTAARDQQRSVNIPVAIESASISPPQDFLRSSLKKSSSTQNQLDQIPSNRTYGLQINPNEHVIHYLDPYTQQKSSSSYAKRSIPDLPSMTTHSLERTVNELKTDMPISYTSVQQKKVTIQLGEKIPPQRITGKQLHVTLNQAPRKTHFEDNVWINDDHRQQMNGKSNGRRSAPLAPHHQDLQMTRQPTSNYPDHPTKNGQQRNFDLSPSKQHRTKSPVRPTNNERVLSVSGKLRCFRCNHELGHGSAMVIESLGLYYHIECFRCFVCNIPLSSALEGIDVRVRSNRLHCQNCFSDEYGVKLSAV